MDATLFNNFSKVIDIHFAQKYHLGYGRSREIFYGKFGKRILFAVVCENYHNARVDREIKKIDQLNNISNQNTDVGYFTGTIFTDAALAHSLAQRFGGEVRQSPESCEAKFAACLVFDSLDNILDCINFHHPEIFSYMVI